MKLIFLLLIICSMQVAQSQVKIEPLDTTKHKIEYGAIPESTSPLKKLIIIDGQIWGFAKSYAQLDSLTAPRITADIRYLKPEEADRKYTLRQSSGAIEIARIGGMYDTKGGVKQNKVEDREPSFQGGPEAWRRFLERNANPMTTEENGAPAGYYTASVKFKVGKDGKLSEFQALSSTGYGTETELVRLLKKSPDWVPGTQNGEPVVSYHVQKLNFVVESELVSFDFKDRPPYELICNKPAIIGISLYEKSEDELEVSISQGTIRPTSKNEYELLVKEKGTIILTVRNKNKNTEVGKASISVR